MKKILLILIIAVMPFTFYGQLPDGSIAPDFTSLDLDSVEHTLYDYLSQGKAVIIDFSATWCGPCWNFHNTHRLKDLYETYGPDGTDEVMVFFVEGDENTTIDDLYGNGGNTYGNWVTGTPYPIINDHTIAEAFQISYWPTVFLICPNRVVREVGTAYTADGFYEQAMTCEFPEHDTEVKLITSYPGERVICSDHVIPTVTIENLGVNDLTSMDINVTVDDNEPQTFNWEGELKIWNEIKLELGHVPVDDGTHELTIELLNPNNTTDGNPDNNSRTVNIDVKSTGTLVDFSFQTDQAPSENSWELLLNDEVVFEEDNYSLKQHLYEDSLCLDYSSCYNFILTDEWGDGMHWQTTGYAEVSFLDNTLMYLSGEGSWTNLMEEFCLLSHQNELISFTIPNMVNDPVVNEENQTIKVYIPSSMDETNIIPEFEVSEYATMNIEGVEQISGISSVDFSEPVEYTITADNGDESVWTISLQKVVSAEALQHQFNQKVYPNPTSGIINIENSENCILEIFDVTGKQVLVKKIENKREALNISNLTNGQYFVKLSNDQKSINGKLLLTK